MDYLQFVNIKQGTASEHRFSNGNTLPLTQLPFAMVGFAPQTEDKGGWFYHPSAHSLEGVRLTHQPSPWIGDYGAFLLTPQTDRIYDEPDDAWSGYRPQDAVLTPAYMKVHFLRSRTTMELTPTQRGAKIRLRFPADRTPYLSILPVYGNYTFRIDAESNTLCATCDGARGDFHVGFCNHLLLSFSSALLVIFSVTQLPNLR